MARKNKCVMKTKLAELNISPKTFQSGDIYLTQDANVLFPSRTVIEDKPRLVVVMGNKQDLNDPLTAYLPVMPITTSSSEERADLPVKAGTGNLHENSLIKAGMIQPILKTDLARKIGKLDNAVLEMLQSTVFINLGLGEEIESENDDEANDEGSC